VQICGGRELVGAQDKFEAAIGLHRAGELERAQRIYRAVLQSTPTHFGAAHMLGALLLQRGDYDQAERQIRRALQIDPNVAEAHNNLGTALRRLGRVDEALAAYDRAIAIKPNYPEALCNRGNALRVLARPKQALESYDQAIALKSDYADAFYNRGGALEDMQRWDDAVASYENAVALNPNFPEAYNNLGNALRAVCRYEEALANYDHAITLVPRYAEALTNRGNALRDLHRYEQALASHDAAIALIPASADAFNNRGSVYRDMRRFDDAICDYRRALALRHDHLESCGNIALTQLLLGDWEQGWEGYELRFKKKHNAARRPNCSAPEWVGEPLAGRRILLFTEQGYGDAIQFIRFVPILLAQGANITVAADSRLHRLLVTVSPGVEFIATVSPDRKFDFQIALMSIPRVLGIRPNNIPAPARYLHADATRVDVWRARLGEHGFKVGLCWQGNPAGSIDNGRSIPLREFLPLAQIDRVRIVSLQKNVGLDQLDTRPPGLTIETPGYEFDGGPDAFVDTAAMMANLDLVVTSDTSIAHLAGALGCPVWVALKHVPDWRWMLDRNDSPWYPAMRLFRQARVDDWAGVIGHIAEKLQNAADHAETNGDVDTAA